MNLDDRELGTVLAGLRLWQEYLVTFAPMGADKRDIATCGGNLRALTAAEIDDLCERLNEEATEREDALVEQARRLAAG